MIVKAASMIRWFGRAIAPTGSTSSYWDFWERHPEQLTTQGRIRFILENLDKMLPEHLRDSREHAIAWHEAHR